jgi:Retrotransposon gag protein
MSTNPQLEEFINQFQQMKLELELLKSNSSNVTVNNLEPRHVSLPEKFNGDRKKFRGFINQIKLLFIINKSRYNSDSLKIATVGTLLTDKALTWYNPMVEKPERYKRELASWETFLALMFSTFGEVDQMRVAANKMRRLTQGSQSASSYAADFRQLAADLDYNESTLIFQFQSGLNNDIKDMLLHFDHPSDLSSCVDMAIRCDNRLYERRQDRREQIPQFNPRTIHRQFAGPQNGLFPHQARQGVSPMPTPEVPKQTPNADYMDIDGLQRGPLSQQERDFRVQNGLCLVCGVKGHYKNQCPKSRRINAMTQLSSVSSTNFPESQ